MNSRDVDSPVPRQAHRGERQPKAQQGVSMKKKRTPSNPPPKHAPVSSRSTGTVRRIMGKGKEIKLEKGKRTGRGAPSVTECQKNLSTPRKRYEASNVSEDLSNDSGCVSGKLSYSDRSSDISDWTEGFLTASEGNQLFADTPSPSCEAGPSGGERKANIDRLSGNAQISERDMSTGGSAFRGLSQENYVMHSVWDGNHSTVLAFLPSLNVSGASMVNSELTRELVDETHEDLVRENDDLRSENQYLKVR